MRKNKKTRKKEILKEDRELKVMFPKSGNGYLNARMVFPMMWLEHMGINPDDRDTIVTYSPRTRKITIRKKSSEKQKEKE